MSIIHRGSSVLTMLVTTALFVLSGGCWDAGLPGTAEVALPHGKVLQAGRDTGPPSLAGTRWRCYRTDDDSFIVGVEFGSTGAVARFYENAVYFPEVLGSELVPDGRRRSTRFPGMTYSAASYGGEDEIGFGFEAHLGIRLLGIEAGRGVAYALGVREGDRLDGTFGYTTAVNPVEGLPFGAGLSDQYEFYAIPESPDP